MEPLTPSLWLGTPIISRPKIADVIDPSNEHVGVIINAYDILIKNKGKVNKIKKDGIKDFLGVQKPVLLDSGGFIFQKKSKIQIKVKELIDLYNFSKPDIAVSLDHPLDPELLPQEDNKRREKTLELLREILLENPEPEIMPVIHGYSIVHLINHLKKTIEIFKDITNRAPKWIGIGSFVPLFRSVKGAGTIPRNLIGLSDRRTLNPTKFALLSIQIIKRIIENKNIKLHVFGVGGATTMKLVYSAGADSLDSVGWRLKAAHGAVQFMGLSDRFMYPRKDPKRKVLPKEKEYLITNCKCNAAPHTRKDLDESFEKRAIHNAYIYQKTVEWISKKREYNETFFKDLNELMKHSTMRRYVPFIEGLNNGQLKNQVNSKIMDIINNPNIIFRN